MLTRIEDLPAFRVTEISADASEPQLTGTFTHRHGVHTGRSWLYAGDDGSLIGDLIDLDSTSGRATFVAPFWSQGSPIQIGSIAPWFDACRQPYHITMIVMPYGEWARMEFSPTAAQHFRQGDVHGWARAGQKLPEGTVPTYVQGEGWDHEHCELCLETIGRGGRPHGYVDQRYHWLCEKCYRDYAEPQNLGFLLAN